MRLSTLAFTASLAFIAVTVVCGYVDGGSLGSDSYHHRRAEWKSQPAVQPHIIHAVNRDNSSTWTAGVNPRFAGMSLHDAASLCGVSPHWMSSYDARPNPLLREAEELFGFEGDMFEDLPTNYDVREQWGETCPSISDISDQSSCGSCWAVSAAGAMSDRNCITSNGTFQAYLSAADILSCCGYQCGTCSGGQPDKAWNYWTQTGVVTGGHYASQEGCWPYPLPPCDHGNSGTRPSCGAEGGSTPYCVRQCRNGNVDNWSQDKNYGYSGYRVGAGRNVQAIMSELYKRGSIQATFYVYSDFLQYRSGVYQRRTGQMLGGHAVRLIGWGVDEVTRVPYWLLANSWNTDWFERNAEPRREAPGENGYFRIRRGTNEAKIEDLLFSGIPTIPTPTPLTEVVRHKVVDLVKEIAKEVITDLE